MSRPRWVSGDNPPKNNNAHLIYAIVTQENIAGQQLHFANWNGEYWRLFRNDDLMFRRVQPLYYLEEPIPQYPSII